MPKGVAAGPLLGVRSPPIFVYLIVNLNNLPIKSDWRAGVRRRHCNDGIDRVGLIVRLHKHSASNDTAHGVPDQDDRRGIGQIGVADNFVGVGIQ